MISVSEWVRAYALLLLRKDGLQSFFEKFATTCTQGWVEVKCLCLPFFLYDRVFFCLFVCFLNDLWIVCFCLRDWLYTNVLTWAPQQCCQQREFDLFLVLLTVRCQRWRRPIRSVLPTRLFWYVFLRSIIGWWVVVSDVGVVVVFVDGGGGGGGGGGLCSDNCHCGSGSIDKRRSTLN